MFDSTEVCGSKSNGTEKLKKFGRLEEVLFAGYLKISFFLQVPGDVLRKTGETKEVNKKNKKKKLEKQTDPKNTMLSGICGKTRKFRQFLSYLVFSAIDPFTSKSYKMVALPHCYHGENMGPEE